MLLERPEKNGDHVSVTRGRIIFIIKLKMLPNYILLLGCEASKLLSLEESTLERYMEASTPVL